MTGNHIVVFKPGPIGDFLHSLPVIYTLKKQFSGSTVTVITGVELCDLIEENPHVDGRIYIPSNIFKKDLPGFLSFIGEVREMKADLFVDLKSNLKSAILALSSGAARTLRYRKQRRIKDGEKRLHAIENLFETILPIAGNLPIDDVRVHLKKEDLASAEDYVRSLNMQSSGGEGSGKTMVALNPNVSIPDSSRHWPPGYFAALGDRAKKELGALVLLIGGPEDRAYCEDVAERMETEPAIAAGQLTLGESGALLSECAVLVTGDTGPLHLAVAVGTKVIALFGSMDPRRAGPYGDGHVVIRKDLWCAPCEEKICPLGTTQCMKDITVDEVFHEVQKILASP